MEKNLPALTPVVKNVVCDNPIASISMLTFLRIICEFF